MSPSLYRVQLIFKNLMAITTDANNVISKYMIKTRIIDVPTEYVAQYIKDDDIIIYIYFRYIFKGAFSLQSGSCFELL